MPSNNMFTLTAYNLEGQFVHDYVACLLSRPYFYNSVYGNMEFKASALLSFFHLTGFSIKITQLDSAISEKITAFPQP